jgi:hypothetical protein
MEVMKDCHYKVIRNTGEWVAKDIMKKEKSTKRNSTRNTKNTRNTENQEEKRVQRKTSKRMISTSQRRKSNSQNQSRKLKSTRTSRTTSLKDGDQFHCFEKNYTVYHSDYDKNGYGAGRLSYLI